MQEKDYHTLLEVDEKRRWNKVEQKKFANIVESLLQTVIIFKH